MSNDPSWFKPGAHGKYAQGGFKGKGKVRMTSQKPSNDNDGCAVIAIALIGGLVAAIGGSGYAIIRTFV